MGKTILKVGVPRETLLSSGFSEEKAAVEMLKLFVMNLYKHQRISAGKAAETLGIRKYDFIQMLGDAGMDFFDYSPTELEEEFETVNKWIQSNE